LSLSPVLSELGKEEPVCEPLYESCELIGGEFDESVLDCALFDIERLDVHSTIIQCFEDVVTDCPGTRHDYPASLRGNILDVGELTDCLYRGIIAFGVDMELRSNTSHIAEFFRRSFGNQAAVRE